MANSSLPEDYLERVYAGVLGKLIGVYIGRPFEGWTHEEIVKELGHVHYYVHEKFDAPLVVTDDDVSGTFVFIRALEEHGISPDLSAEDIGKTWLNNIVEKKAILWWGGNGISTEHTAFLNLKHGIKAPASGSIETNGKALAEQIGAQIFIDGWAMVAPGNPELAAKLAEAAGSVSHDGDSVHAAKLWAAMEAEAFVSKDPDHLLDVGLKYVPADSLITKLVADIRGWAKVDQDWEKTRQRIEDKYGYDKFPGICHVIPNHGLMIATLIYAGHDFHSAMHIINTCGWDTDCNSGNIGCLVGIMHGLSAFEGGPDWRGPLADRALISSGDAGYSINNAVRITYDLANLGRKLAGQEALPAPKDGAQFHFSLPGSVQGFIATRNELLSSRVKIEQAIDSKNRPGLAIHLNGWANESQPVEVLTQVFTPPEIVTMKTYELMASPLVSPGQTITAVVFAENSNSEAVSVNLRLKHYNATETLSTFDGPSTTLSPGGEKTITWTIPDSFDSQPIQQLGLALSCPKGHISGTVHLHSLAYSGSPNMTLKRPSTAKSYSTTHGQRKFWTRALVDNMSTLHTSFGSASFFMARDRGEGIMTTGTRDWKDYKVTVPSLKIGIGSVGVCVRVQGLNRYYALMFNSDRKSVALIKAKDEDRTVLASADYAWETDVSYKVSVVVEGEKISGFINDKKIAEASDGEYVGGGIGAIVVDGSASADRFDIAPLKL